MLESKHPGKDLAEGQNNLIAVWRLTALWGFSEAAFGGLLHAFKIPFTGIFIGGAAVLFISLIAFYSSDRGTILKATITVILIKAMVSPHSPVNAYIAVSLQGLLGELFFLTRKYYKISALLLGITAVVLSSVQKLLVLTIIFGNTLWESIDLFAEFIMREFFPSQQTLYDINLSYILISLYLILHFAAGSLIGITAGKLPKWIREINSEEHDNLLIYTNNSAPAPAKKKRRNWWLRPKNIAMLIFSAIVLFITYMYPELSENESLDIIIMMVRSIIIIFVWYSFISPLLTKMLMKILNNKKSFYSNELQNLISMFPQFRALLTYCWKRSSKFSFFKRIKYFLSHSFFLLLSSDLEHR